MKMKKMYSLFVGTILLASGILTGCGKTENAAENEQEQVEEVQEETAEKIVIFQSKVDIIDGLESLAVDYEEETGIEVEVWEAPGDDYYQQLKAKLASNQGPTIMSLVPGTESEQMKNYLADLSDLEFVDKIAEGMTDVVDETIVGIPQTVEGFGVVYNEDLIDTAKLTSTDEFINMLKEQNEAGINGFALSQESYFLIGHILNTPFSLQEDSKAFMQNVIEGKVNLKDVEEFQEFAKLFEAIKIYCDNPMETSYDQQCGDFATGKSASIHQGNWAYSMFTDYEMDFAMGMAPLPLCGNDKLAVSVPSAWYVNSQASEAEQQAGKDFLEWLYTSETGIHYLMDEYDFIPVVEGMENKGMNVLAQEVADYTEAGKTMPWALNYYPAGIVDVYLQPIVESFFTTDMSGDELLDEITNAFIQAGTAK